jgi:hypothetical protein
MKTVEALHEYIAKKIRYPGDMWSLTTELTEPKVPKPDRVTEQDLEDDHFLKAVWTKEVSSYVTRREQLKQNMRAVSAVILGQCSEAMKAKLKSNSDFKERYAKADCVWLLVTIRATMLKFEGHQYIFLGLQDALTAICNHRQGDNDLTTYRAELESLVQAYETYGGEFGRSTELMDKIEDLEGSTGLSAEEKSKKAHDRAVALKFLQGADRRTYGTLWVGMQNNYSLGLRQYPSDLTEAYTMLLNYVPPETLTNRDRTRTHRRTQAQHRYQPPSHP